MTYGLHRRLAYLRSSPVTLPENEDFMKLELNKGVRNTQGGAQTHDASEQKVKIPSIATAFQINSIEGNIARNKNGEPEQVVILSTTADIGTRELAKAVKVWLLPKRKPETKEESETAETESAEQTDSSAESKESSASDESEDTTEESKDENSKWQSATDVPDGVLEQAKPVEFTPIPSEKAQDRQHAFRVRVETDGELYIRVAKGVRAFGDYPLAEDYNAVVAVPELPREVQIQSQGGLLALSGERKLSIRSRGLSAIEYEIARVATTQINHLVSQTGGKFEDPEFHEPSLFNKENISRIAVQHQPIALENKWKANYSAFDFSEQLRKPSDGGSERGLFFLIVHGWDPAKKKAIQSIKDSRFLLVTDIGILTKKNTDGGSDVFLVSIETEVVDARDLKVQTKKVTLSESGFVELSYQTANESPTGVYTINVYLVKNNKRGTLLGSTTASVKEFLPDRMKIETRLSKGTPRGWVNPNDMRASIALANLYGTPATDRRVTGKVELAPAEFSFPEFKDFTFFDPLIDEKKTRTEQTVDLGEKKTDNDGHTEFELQLERFADSTYSMRLIAEGFEGEGGRSVTGYVNALDSALPHVVGYKAEGDLRYIDANKPRALDLIAVDSQLNRIAVENVTLNVIAQEYVSVLKKQENGNYVYESVLRERSAKSEKIVVAAGGLHYALPTTEPGDYVLELRDDQNRILSKLHFSVVGQGATARSLEKNAELEIKLDRKQYNAGDDIAISIVAPYAGSGLITIEREKVYTYSWFQTNTASSIQHIRLPEGFEGSGYVSVAFVRALDSKQVFVSPLSYGVVPFTANVEKRRLKIDIQTPATVKPGDALRIGYQTDRPSKIVIFAVDQGILQVTDYKTPNPLQYFFRKCALGVETAQIVDLIIPEFSLLRSLSAFGGDGGEVQRLNPFKRVTEKPVVFWSGILDADTNAREVTYNVPDFFDGTLKIMAVGVSSETTGSSDRDALIS